MQGGEFSAPAWKEGASGVLRAWPGGGGGEPGGPVPEVLRCQHLVVVEKFAPGAGAVHGRQDILCAREAAGRGGRGAVHSPLQQVDARPPGHVGALKQAVKPQAPVRLGRGAPFYTSLPATPSFWGVPKSPVLPLCCYRIFMATESLPLNLVGESGLGGAGTTEVWFG